MYQIVNEEPQKPSLLNPEIPEILDTIVAKCLAKKPEDRYQNASDLAGDLHSCRSKLPHAKNGLERRGDHFTGGGAIHGKQVNKLKWINIIVLIALLSVGLFELIERLIERYL
jgi:serine/threonine protein kinase